MTVSRPVDSGTRRLLRQQVLLVAVCAGVALLVMALPLQDVHIAPRYFLPLHALLEFVPILAAFLVFTTVWHTPEKEISASLLWIAAAIFVAGWLDFAHASSFNELPDLLTLSVDKKGIAFRLVARLVVALILFGVSFYPQLRSPSKWGRYRILAACTVMNLVLMAGVLFYERSVPDTMIASAGGGAPLLTSRGLEWLIMGLLVLAAWRYYRRARLSADEFLPLIFAAASVAALGELLLSGYETVSDVNSLLGHLYKLVSYGLIYQAMFIGSVRKPYQQLAAHTQTLLKANETLRSQSLALESTSTPVLVTDLLGQVQWRNRASRAIWSSQSAAFENTLSLFSAPMTPNPKTADNIRATIQAGRVWRGLVHTRDEQGHDIVLNRAVTPLRNEADVIEGYVIVAENVTESIKAQLRHKRVLDTALDGFWITDTQGRLLEVNEAYARMSGYATEELLTMSFGELEAVMQPQEVQARIKQLIQQGRAQFETRHRHKLGHEFSVDISATYDPEHGQLFIFLHDRSERIQAAEVKQDLERQLQQSQKLQELGQLTGGIAHDFNNILAAILGYSNLALERFAPDKQGKLASYLREVISASERARDLIAKMLTFTRMQPSANVDVISPAAVIEDVLAMTRPSIPSSIQIKCRIEDSLRIRMDPGELSQVLVNLIINARDAIGGHGMIDIRLHQVTMNGQICMASQQRLSGVYLAIDVSDTGSGIAPEHISRVFDPFFTTKEVGKGTGLGLSMVLGILRRASGHVVVESQPGRGSQFQLLFPIASPKENSPHIQPGNLQTKSGLGQHIWVVDDEPAVARYLGELLDGAGYSIRLFNVPSDVLSAFAIEQNDVDLLITDQTMPGLNGVELALRLHSIRPNLPIILCTGYGDVLNRSEALQHGIRRYFTKPVPTKELLKALAEELGSK